MKRKIIKIDEEKCNGCGICARACHEGAIQIVNGKARLVSESYCDGLGDCIGECPQGAITFEEREAAPYDEEAVKLHLASRVKDNTSLLSCGCPGSMARDLRNVSSSSKIRNTIEKEPISSRLGNWPVQIRLIPAHASYLQNANLVVAADCTAYAFADFHRHFLEKEDTVCLIGCPKLDDAQEYAEKMSQIITENTPPTITVVHMEVPCCSGLIHLMENAIEKAKVNLTLNVVKIGIRGDILNRESIKYIFS
jgi:ferredoxin